MWKHVAVLLATTAAFGVSLSMMGQAIGYDSPWMVLLVMLCFLGLGRIAEPIFVLKVPASLRRLRPWETHGNAYRKLGVPQFGALLRDTPLRLLNLDVYVARAGGDALRVHRLVESAEANHFWAGLLITPYLVACAWSGKWAILGCFLALQIAGNVYPILHLRWVRGRLDRVLGRRRSPARAAARPGPAASAGGAAASPDRVGEVRRDG